MNELSRARVIKVNNSSRIIEQAVVKMQGNIVKIHWICFEKGGRKNPPTGPQYSTVARFEDVKDKWPIEAWSVVIDFIKHGEDFSEGNMRFLVEWAPSNLLYTGSKFDLFEGNKKVAIGVIL